MSTFGADIGRILRSPLPALAKLAAVVLRYHAPDGARAERIAEVSGIGRAKTFALLADLKTEGVAEKREDRWHYMAGADTAQDVRNQSTTWTDAPEEVHHMDKKSTEWTGEVHGMDSRVHHMDSKVHHMDSPPAPPNKVLQTFSRPSPDVAAANAPAPAPATPDFLAVERTWLDNTGGGLQAKNVEADALKTLADTHGPAAVITAIEEAVLANTRGRISVNFVRAILERKAGAPTRQEPRGPAYVMPPEPRPIAPPREETDEERAAVLAAWGDLDT